MRPLQQATACQVEMLVRGLAVSVGLGSRREAEHVAVGASYASGPPARGRSRHRRVACGGRPFAVSCMAAGMSGSPPLAEGPAERELARRFQQHVLADVDYLKSGGYNPTQFLGMIAQSGSAVAVAKRLFSDPRHTSYGFERLWEMGELGRSVEFAANLPWFRSLFTEDELDEAQSRLTLHDFPVEQRLAAAAAHSPDWSVQQ